MYFHRYWNYDFNFVDFYIYSFRHEKKCWCFKKNQQQNATNHRWKKMVSLNFKWGLSIQWNEKKNTEFMCFCHFVFPYLPYFRMPTIWISCASDTWMVFVQVFKIFGPISKKPYYHSCKKYAERRKKTNLNLLAIWYQFWFVPIVCVNCERKNHLISYKLCIKI